MKKWLEEKQKKVTRRNVSFETHRQKLVTEHTSKVHGHGYFISVMDWFG